MSDGLRDKCKKTSDAHEEYKIEIQHIANWYL